ncbi:MAG: hypothetical protein FJ312_10340 [SAR202 cluster bacterium]|nr:hypothetical protein [SAR202 cluster bacterium]
MPSLLSMRKPLRIPGVCVVTAALLLTACADGDGAPATSIQSPTELPGQAVRLAVSASVLIAADAALSVRPVSEVRITPGSVVADVGQTVALKAEAFDASGSPVEDVELVWNTVDPRAGSLDEDGLFIAGNIPGRYEQGLSVTAVHNTPDGIKYVSRMIAVTVVGEAEMPVLTSVTIFPERPRLLTEQIYRLRAVAFDQDGLLIPTASYVWQVNDASLGRINSLGYLTVEGKPGLYEGAVTATAIWDGVTATAATDIEIVDTEAGETVLKVQALPQNFHLDPGDKLQLRAVAINGLGELVRGTELRWSVINDQAGTIDGRGMFVAGLTPGIYTEAVKVEAVVLGEQGYVRAEDYASLVIRSPKELSLRMAALNVVPGTVAGPAGTRALVIAHVVDEHGRAVQGVNIRWEAVNESVGEIDMNGAFKIAGSPGIYKGALKATAEQQLGEELVTLSQTVNVVITGTMTSARIQPSLATIAPGRTMHFAVSVEDEFGTALSGLSYSWSVSDPVVGTIDDFGNFTAGNVTGLFENAIQVEVVQTLPR